MDLQREVAYDYHKLKMANLNKMKAAINAVLSLKVWENKEEYAKFCGLMIKAINGDKDAERKVAKQMRSVFSANTDLMTGYPANNEFLRSKGISELAAPGQLPQVLQTYSIWAGDFELDMQWSLVYATSDMRNNMTGKIQDFRSAVEIKELAEGKDVEYGHIGETTGTPVSYRRLGGGLAFERRWLETNGFITANDAMQAIRMKHETKKDEIAYKVLTETIGQTQTWDTDLQTTLNKAYSDKIIEVNKAKGYGLSGTTTVYLYHHHSLTQTVNKAIFALRGENGTNPVVEFNIVPISTHYIPKQLKQDNTGTAHDAVLMVLPGRKIVYTPWEDPSENEAFKWGTNRIQMGIQEKYNFHVLDKEQLVKVRLSA